MDDGIKRIDDYLAFWAAQCPDKVAVTYDKQRVTYSRLHELVAQRVERLSTEGFVGGKAWVGKASYNIDFLVTYFAVHLLGGVMVPLESSVSLATESELRDSLSHTLIPDGTADILFTTGTTGKSKGVMLSHDAILADADNLVDAHGFRNDLTFIICGPLNHIGSLSKIWPTLMVGATLHITGGMKDTNTFFDAIDRSEHKVATFLVPAGIRLLLAFSKRQLAELAEKIDFIETGAAPISQQDMEQLCQLLPDTRLYNTYASTETGIICTHNYNAGFCQAGCLGKPMKNSSVFITKEGTVACSGKTLMTGYFNDEETTRQILRSGVVYTHDQGHIDAAGRLHLTGRADDIINVGGFKVNPIEVERVAMSFNGLSECICVPAHHPVLGTVLRLVVVMKDHTPLDKRALASFLAERLEHYKVPSFYSETDKLHRTYNGKLNRNYYNNFVNKG